MDWLVLDSGSYQDQSSSFPFASILVWGETQMTLIITKAIYFSIATVYVIVCIVTYFALRRLEFVRYCMSWQSLKYESERNEDVISRKSSSNDIKLEGDLFKNEGTPEKVNRTAIEADENIESGTNEGCLKCNIYWRRYIETFRECWLQCFTVWLVCACSLSLFPAIQSLVEPFSKHYFITKTWFADVTCFFFFNLFSLLGCLLATRIHVVGQIALINNSIIKIVILIFLQPGPRFLWIPAIFRFGFIPFFLVSNYQIDGDRKMPLLLVNDHVYILGSIIFAFTGGYFTSLAMMYATK
ncbi:unnamed protein product [Hymenolepis diminuta]|uniref:Na_H_Exchanger domain-containing protein n=1 Tax=Hymenolepis diminuta TaxID=6216 RepID=A0A0R3SXL4_HYMDI|nr:unnamed protein product [Hymenolepis diminuta]